ncbi:MAG: hypothetical protein WD009_10665 [Phycisphaeraceae bacterium]
MLHDVNGAEVRVIGLSRSGNHAILNWIYAQAPGRACLLNCVEGRLNPFATARPMEDGLPYRVNYPGFDPDAERAGRFSVKDWLIFSHEDAYLGNASSPEFERGHDALVGPSGRRVDVLVLRDPYNLFASRLRWGQCVISPGIAAQMWKQHAREYLGETRRLRHEPVLISYNRWVRDRDYRRRLARRLGLTFTDAGVREVAGCNGGSSFDGMRYQGRAHRMKVFERWRAYIDEPGFRRPFNEEVTELAREAFGPMPEPEQALGLGLAVSPANS